MAPASTGHGGDGGSEGYSRAAIGAAVAATAGSIQQSLQKPPAAEPGRLLEAGLELPAPPMRHNKTTTVYGMGKPTTLQSTS